MLGSLSQSTIAFIQTYFFPTAYAIGYTLTPATRAESICVTSVVKTKETELHLSNLNHLTKILRAAETRHYMLGLRSTILRLQYAAGLIYRYNRNEAIGERLSRNN